MKNSNSQIIWKEVTFTQNISISNVTALLTHIASLSPRKTVVWEARGSGGKIRYFVGTRRRYWRALQSAFSAHGKPELATIPEKTRTLMNSAKRLKLSRPNEYLNLANSPLAIKTALSALSKTGENETLTLQMILGDSLSDPHGFYTLIRIGANASTAKRANALILSLMSAFRILEKKGVHLLFCNTCPHNLNHATVPLFLPLRLSVAELAGFILLPCTEAVGVKHPKIVPPPDWLKNGKNRTFATSIGATPKKLEIPQKDALEHTVILGATGAGKSNIMLNLALADIQAGRSVLVIDPKADLVNDILARVPKNRTNDVILIDPSDAQPVGINPFVFNTQAQPSHISDTILSVFKQIYSDSWGVFSQDVLSASLLTLAQTKNSTLLDLPKLLTDERFRRKVTAKISDKAGLEPFWEQFEAMSKAEQRKVIAPVMNKLRQFTLRPHLRNVLGQEKPKFELSELFDSNKIVLVPLNKGIIGAESARLLGSLIVGLTWVLALSRANKPQKERHPVNIYIDEFHDYLALCDDFESALSVGRGLGVGFTVAHQYRGQLSPSIKEAIDANARNKICFTLNSANAKNMAAMAPELEAEDFMKLPRYHIYAQLQNDGRSTGWMSGKTLPAPPPLRLPVELKAASMERYGQNPAELEQIPTADPLSVSIGRKKTI
ncbi:MAG: type IV secretion system DNA-binding domain-containing protein [Oscillospiraceae bacterium]|nr:type IV secretion system DNA-binding domain-containing protein [Oscillospiraceae bacterium]